MQDGQYTYEENEVEIKKYKIVEKTRIAWRIAERYTTVMERSKGSVHTCVPSERRIEIVDNAARKSPRYVKIENPTNLGYLSRNLQNEDDEKCTQIMTSDETITVVKDCGLKYHGGFEWVAA